MCRMTPREIANLCCRVLAVYALLQGIGLLPRSAALIWPFIQSRVSMNEAVLAALMGAAEPVLWLSAGAFLWRWSGLVAAWMVGTNLQDHRNEAESLPRKATAETVHLIAFSTVGLWLLVEVAPRFLGYLAQLITIRLQEGHWSSIDGAAWIGTFIEESLRLAIGLYLLFGASGLLRIVRSAKNFGLEEGEQPEYAARDKPPTPPQDS